jgi:predicted ATPase
MGATTANSGTSPNCSAIKGEVLLGQSLDQAVEALACFDQAAEMARGQGALFWEFRAALSAAGLLVRQTSRARAAQVLQPVYDRFTEGFEVPDLRAARALLDTLR